MNKTLNFWAAAALLLALFAAVSTMDYDDAVADAEHYDAMVCGGLWPDFDGRRPQCTGGKK